MYTLVEHEVWRQRAEELRQEVAMDRLETMARADTRGRYLLMGDSKWELERYAGLFKKRLRDLKYREREEARIGRGT
jgi:hypothetical protein